MVLKGQGTRFFPQRMLSRSDKVVTVSQSFHTDSGRMFSKIPKAQCYLPDLYGSSLFLSQFVHLTTHFILDFLNTNDHIMPLVAKKLSTEFPLAIQKIANAVVLPKNKWDHRLSSRLSHHML